ncbi:MAG: Gfo/Idh/MocA family oxidoreductase [Bacteroidetes bacterium]|nr:Gfo/Idh/MocA family oxidoreductase [Bacteroidota bacterium]
MLPAKIKFALIGCGYWGANFLRILAGSPLVTLVSVCDTDAGRREAMQALYPHVTFTGDIADVTGDTEIHAAVICTPVETHLPLTEQLLRSGKHVLCEKPLTSTAQECLYLYDLAQQMQRCLMVGHVFEYNSVINYMQHMIAADQIGPLRYLQFTRMGLGPVRRDVSVVFDLAAHDVAIALSIAGTMPLSVMATGQSFQPSGLEDVAFIQLIFPRGVIASINVSWLDPIKQRLVKVVGRDKMLLFDDLSLGEKLKIVEMGQNYQDAKGDFGSFQLSVKDGQIIIPNLQYPESLLTELEHFAECIRTGAVPRTDGRYAYRVVRVLEAAQESIRHDGKKIWIT